MIASEIKEEAGFYYHSFVGYFSKAGMYGDSDAVHQYRVSLKSFYALHAFVALNMKEEGSGRLDELVKFLRPIYQMGGKLRDLQVLISLSSAIGLVIPPVLYTFLYSKYEKRLHKFIQLHSSFEFPSEVLFVRLMNELIDRYYFGGPVELASFIERKNYEACLLLKKRPGKEWHVSRGLIKQNYLLVKMALRRGPARFSKKLIQSLKRLEHSLGLWHDIQNMYTVMDKLEAAKKDETVVLFRRSLTREKTKKEEEIRDLIFKESLLF